MEKKVDEMYFLSYPENMDLYSWNTNFTTSKIINFFHSKRSLKIKALSSLMLKKKYRVVIDDQNKNIVCNLNWTRYLFDFDARYRDLNLIFVFDSSTKKPFLTSDIFIKAATIVNDEYLRYGKNFDINAFFTDWFVSKKKGNGVVIRNYEDYQKLPTNKKYLMPLIQTNNGLYIHLGAICFTRLKEFKNGS